jgi:hypothetical protein
LARTEIRDTFRSWMHAGRRRHTVCSLLNAQHQTTVEGPKGVTTGMFGKKKGAPEPQQQSFAASPDGGAAADGIYPRGQQPNNQPRSYTPPTRPGGALPGQAGYVTYKLRGRNAMTDIRFKYVRPDGKPDPPRGGRYAK